MRPTTTRQPLDVTNWVRGIITEASPLSFPEGSSVDEENFVLSIDGSRKRRLGIDYEAGYTLTNLEDTSAGNTKAIHNFVWKNAKENPSSDFLVHQWGNRLYFYNANTTAVSSNALFGGPLSLTATIATRFSFASIQGLLLVSCGDQYLRIIAQENSASLSLTASRILIRDFFGVDDGFDVNERTATLTHKHAYNLYNQGWPPTFFCTTEGTANPTQMDNGTTTDPVENTKTYYGKYPSNSDVIYSAMTGLTNGRRAYFCFALDNVTAGNSPAPKGHYIIDLFNRSQGRIDTYAADIAAGFPSRDNYTSGLTTDQSTGGIKAVASYAGRIWYGCTAGETGGDNRSPHVGTFIVFSRLVDSVGDLAKCYQDLDPTSEDLSDILDTDGGYIQIPAMVGFRGFSPVGSSLMVFAANGVWEISGGTSGFSATDYQTRFITNNGVVSLETVLDVNGGAVYWSRNGVYSIQSGSSKDTGLLTGAISAVSLTDSTIKTLYDDIPIRSKEYATGFYDDTDFRLRWLYQTAFDSTKPYRYDTELIFDLRLQAWSKFTIKPSQYDTPKLTGYLLVPEASRNLAGANYKYTASAQNTSLTWVSTVAHYRQEKFRDWFSHDSLGADAAAYLVTGYFTGGDSARHKYIPYLTTHFVRTGIEGNSATFSSTATISSSCVYDQAMVLNGINYWWPLATMMADGYEANHGDAGPMPLYETTYAGHPIDAAAVTLNTCDTGGLYCDLEPSGVTVHASVPGNTNTLTAGFWMYLNGAPVGNDYRRGLFTNDTRWQDLTTTADAAPYLHYGFALVLQLDLSIEIQLGQSTTPIPPSEYPTFPYSNRTTAPGVVSVGTRTMIALKFSPSTLLNGITTNLYVNGVEQALSANSSLSVSYAAPITAGIQYGFVSNGGAKWGTPYCTIDSPFYQTAALSASQIYAMYVAGI